MNAPHVQVSWGELFDKISILEIKSARLTSEAALSNVQRELDLLAIKARMIPSGHTKIDDLKVTLKVVNEALWEIEDEIREKEAAKQFDATFINLARSVYLQNDKRSAIKRAINVLLASDIIEEKSYKDYHNGS